MKRRAPLCKVVLALATSGMVLQFSSCNSTVSALVLNATNQSVQLLASSLINAFFFSLGNANRLPPATSA